MTIYHFFRVDSTGRIAAREEHECRTTTDAFNTAHAISHGQDVEVWRGSVRIALRKRDRLCAVAKHLMPKAQAPTD